MSKRHFRLRRPRFLVDAVEPRLLLAATVSLSDASISEQGGGVLAFAANRAGSPVGSVTIPFATESGTATLGTDFFPINGSVTIPHGGASGSAMVQAVDDALHEGNETLTVQLDAGRADLTGAPATFGPVVARSTGALPAAAAVGDFNLDGKPDLVVGTASAPSFTVLMNTTVLGGASPVFTRQDYPTTRPGRGVAVIDFNADGKPDVAVTQDDDVVTLWRNVTAPGSPASAFVPAGRFDVPADPADARAADFNLDGRSDLVVVSAVDRSLSVLRNTTPAGAEQAGFDVQTVALGPPGPTNAVPVDVNTDGRPDLMVTSNGAPAAVMINLTPPGADTVAFTPRQVVGAGIGAFEGYAGDVDGDGRTDLVGDSVALNRTPAGSTTAVFVERVIAAPGQRRGVVDVNGDGKLDLLNANEQTRRVGVLINHTRPGDASLSFVLSENTELAAAPGAFASADFTLDGRPDLGVLQGALDQISIIPNTTPLSSSDLPHFSGDVLTPGALPHASVVADLNRDGRADLAVANQGSGDVFVYLGTAAPGAPPEFAPPVTFATGSLCVSIVARDFNRDGTPDLATANAGDDALTVLLNTTAPGAAAPSFAAPQALVVGARPRFVAAGDFNGDGLVDLASANFVGDTVSVLLNQTTPGAPAVTFAARQDFATADGPLALVVGDYNADGRPDLAAAAFEASRVTVLLNSTAPGGATPGFGNRQDVITGARPRGVAAGDLNGDGRLDLAVATHGDLPTDDTITVLLNTTAPGSSTPAFNVRQDYATGANPIFVAIEDVNLDGRPDLAVANYGAAAVSVLMNATPPGSAPPSFPLKVDFPVEAGPIHIAAGDLDGDGRAELIATSFDASRFNVLRNQPVRVVDGTATGTIVNDDQQPSARFASALTSVDEGAGTANVIVELTAPSSFDLAVPFTLGGTATSPADFTVTLGSVLIPAGQTSGSIEVDLVDDALDEPDEQVVFTLGMPTGGTVVWTDLVPDISVEGYWTEGPGGHPIAHTVATDLNLDGVGTAELVFFSEVTTNAGRPVSLGTRVTGPTIMALPPLTGVARLGAGELIAPLSPWGGGGYIAHVDGGSWGSGRGFLGARVVDGTSTYGRLGWVDLSVTGIRLTLHAFALESGPNVAVAAGGVVGGRAVHALVITDNDPLPTVEFQPAAQSIAEGGGTATVGVRLSAVSARDVTIPFSVGGSAAQNVDFQLVGANPLVIPAGQVEGAVAVNVMDDVEHEPDETVVLTLGTPTNGTTGATDAHTLTILDNDPLPMLEASEFNFLTAPQSLRFRFNRNVSASLSTSDLVLRNATLGVNIDPSAMALSYEAATNTATFTFPGLFGQYLFDGDYHATIDRNAVTDQAGNPLASDVSFDFFFLQGDANRDRRVNLRDFNVLAANFGQASRDFAQGNFNYDDVVNLADFNLLAARFGTSLDAGPSGARGGNADARRGAALGDLRGQIAAGRTALPARFAQRVIDEIDELIA